MKRNACEKIRDSEFLKRRHFPTGRSATFLGPILRLRALPFLIAAASASLALATLSGLWGCGGESPAEWLGKCRRAVEEYAAVRGYLHFVQESTNIVRTSQGTLEEWFKAEGDIVLPEREKYEYRQELTSSLQPGEGAVNAFSYITVDGGKTAYVMGERLSAELGVKGWVHYTPPQGQSRFLDYRKLVERVTEMGGSAEWLGYEEVSGVRCAYLSMHASGRELVDLRLREDPGLLEKYPELGEGEFAGEMAVRLWIAAESGLPVRMIMEIGSGEGGEVTVSGRMELLFSGYGETPPSPIEAPAAFMEAG